MDYSMPGFHVLHYLPEFESVMSSSHFILCHPLLLLPSVFPSIRAFSSESVLHISRHNIDLHYLVVTLAYNP